MSTETAPIFKKEKEKEISPAILPVSEVSSGLNGKWNPPENDHTDTRALQGEEREKFILRYLGQVEIIANIIRRTLPDNIEVGDLIQEGVLGLLNAMRLYNPSKAAFNTFSDCKIHGAIRDYLREEDHLKRPTRERVKEISKMLEENKDKVNHGLKPLTDEEMAAKLGISIEEYWVYLNLVIADSSNQPNKPLKDGKIKDLYDKKMLHPDELAHKKEITRIIRAAFEKFLLGIKNDHIKDKGKQDAYITKQKKTFRDLFERYYLQGRFLSNIGKDEDFGVGQSRVSQLLIELNNGIKSVLEAKGFRPGDVDW
jgi:RNA polymerase sigma factor for flagellar operon FliA